MSNIRLIVTPVLCSMILVSCGTPNQITQPEAPTSASKTAPTTTQGIQEVLPTETQVIVKPALPDTPLPVQAGPSPRTGAIMFYDPIARRTILMGGFSCEMSWSFEPMHYSDIWAYHAEDEYWEEIGEYDIHNGMNFGYDAKSKRVIFLTSGPIKTWSYDPATGEVEELDPEDMPPDSRWAFNFFGTDMAYDAESDRLILFGGAEGPDTTYGDTWAYDYNSNTWTNMKPKNSPPNLAFYQTAYDSESDRVLLWGGYPNVENDTSMWSYDYNTNSWESFETINGPETHYERFGMVYHPLSDRTILYSGFVEERVEREELFLEPATWSYDFNNNQWEEIITDENPGKRMWYSMVYDEAADQIILFGGEQTAKYEVDLTNAVWVFDFDSMQWRDTKLGSDDCST